MKYIIMLKPYEQDKDYWLEDVTNIFYVVKCGQLTKDITKAKHYSDSVIDKTVALEKTLRRGDYYKIPVEYTMKPAEIVK